MGKIADTVRLRLVQSPLTTRIQKLDLVLQMSEAFMIEAIKSTEEFTSYDIEEILNTILDEEIARKALLEIEGLSDSVQMHLFDQINSNPIKIEIIKKLENTSSTNKACMIAEINNNDEIKVELMQETKGLSPSDKKYIIGSLDDNRLKVKLMKETEGLSSSDKVHIIVSINDNELKEELMKETEGLSSSDKANIIESISDDGIKEKLMKETEGLSPSDKVHIIISIRDISLKIKVIQETTELTTDLIIEILSNIRREDEIIKALKEIKSLSSSEKTKIITSRYFFKKVIVGRIINEIEDLTPSDKAEIIASIEDDDELKIKLMGEVPDLSPNDKSKIIISISNDNKRLKLMEETEGIDKFDKAKILLMSLKGRAIKIKIVCDMIGVEKDVLDRMLKTNMDLFKNIDLRILQPTFLKTLGEERINLISCFPRIQNLVLKLTEKELVLFDKCIDRFMEQSETDEWTNLAELLLNNFEQYKSLIESIDDINNLSEEDLEDLTRIMQSDNWLEIYTMEEVRDYDRIKEEKCQEVIEDENASVEKKREAVLIKIFGHDESYAKKMIEKYGIDIENIEDCEMKDYIRTLKLILELDNPDILHEIFEQCTYAELDRITAERTLKNQYFKTYLSDLYIPREEDRKGHGCIYEAGTDFKMLMTSVAAYVNDGFIPNYREDWNRPAIASQHFCASYIRNDMIGTAEITHICYGFSSIREDALMLSGPNDILSSDTGWISTASHEIYYTADKQIDNTRRHNEMDIRRVQGGIKLQPDYIIVFRKNGIIPNMIEARRASMQWNGMPIVIVDIDKCLEAERTKVDTMLMEYKETKSKQLARDIIQKVRNNRVTDEQFCQDIEIEIRKLKQEIDNEDPKKEIHEGKKDSEVFGEDELKEVYDLVPAEDRQKGISRIREIYRKVKQIINSGNDERRYR